MPNNSDNIGQLYNSLRSAGYDDIGTEQEFREYVSDENNVKNLHTALEDAGYDDIGSEQEFSEWLQPKQEAQQEQTASSKTEQQPEQPQQGKTSLLEEIGEGIGNAFNKVKESVQPDKFMDTVNAYAHERDKEGKNEPADIGADGVKKDFTGLISEAADLFGIGKGKENEQPANGQQTERAEKGDEQTQYYYNQLKELYDNKVKPGTESAYRQLYDLGSGDEGDYGVIITPKSGTYNDEGMSVVNMRDAQGNVQTEARLGTGRRDEKLAEAVDMFAHDKAREEADNLLKNVSDGVDPETAFDELKKSYYTDGEQNRLWLVANKIGIPYDEFIENYMRPAINESAEQTHNGLTFPVGQLTADWRVAGELDKEHDPNALNKSERTIYDYLLKEFDKKLASSEAEGEKAAANINAFGQMSSPSAYGPIAQGGVGMNAYREYNKYADPQKAIEYVVDKLYNGSGEGNGGAGNINKQAIGKLLYSRIVDKLVAERVPKSKWGYVLKGFMDSDLGNILKASTGTPFQRHLDELADSKYSRSLKGFEGWLATGGHEALKFLADSWEYYLGGTVGNLAAGALRSRAVRKMTEDLVMRGIKESTARGMAVRVLSSTAQTGLQKLKQASVHGAATMATASTISGSLRQGLSPAAGAKLDEIEERRAGGETISKRQEQQELAEANSKAHNIFNVLGAGIKEGASGAASGLAFGPGAAIGDAVSKLTGRYMGSLVSSAAGYTSKLGTNAASMTALSQLEGAITGQKPEGSIANQFMQNLVTFAMMDAQGKMNSLSLHPFRDARSRREAGYKHIISDEDEKRMRDAGYGSLLDSIDKLGAHGNDTYEDTGVNYKMMQFLGDKSLPEELKAKYYRVITGRDMPLSPVTGSEITHDDKGYYVITYNPNGDVVSDHRYRTKAEADKMNAEYQKDVEKNTLKVLEDTVSDADFLDDLDIAEQYARENAARDGKTYEEQRDGVTDDDKDILLVANNRETLGETIRKYQSGGELTNAEQAQLSALVRLHTKIKETRIKSMRKNVERDNNLSEGGLQQAIDGHESKEEAQKLAGEGEQVYKSDDGKWRTNDEIGALDDYRMQLEDMLREKAGSSEAQQAEEGNEAVENGGLPYEQTEFEKRANDSVDAGKRIIGDGNMMAGAADFADRRQHAVTDFGAVFDSNGKDAEKVRQLATILDSHDSEAMQEWLNGNAGNLSDEQRDAVMALWDCANVEDGVQQQIETLVGEAGEKERKDCEQYVGSDGNITTLTTKDGGNYFYLSGDMSDIDGSIIAADADGARKQIYVSDIASKGEPVSLEQHITDVQNQLRQQLQNEYNDIANGRTLQPGMEADVILNGNLLHIKCTAEDENGVTAELADGSAYTFSHDELETAINGARQQRAAVEAEAAAQTKAAKEREERFKNGIAGYADGNPDLSAPETNAKAAAEYLQYLEQQGQPHDDIKQSLRNKVLEYANTANDVSEKISKLKSEYSILDPGSVDAKEKEKEIEADEQKLRELKSRAVKEARLRNDFLTENERSQEAQERQAKVREIEGKLPEDSSNTPDLTIPDMSKEYLIGNYESKEDAAQYLDSEKEKFRQMFNEARDDYDDSDRIVREYLNGEYPYTDKELNKALAERSKAKAEMGEISEAASAIGKVKKLLPLTYKDVPVKGKEPEAIDWHSISNRKELLATARKAFGADWEYDDSQEQTPEAIVAHYLPANSLLASDMMAETSMTWEDLKKLSYYFGNPDKERAYNRKLMTVKAAAEYCLADVKDYLGERIDENEIRNAILEMFQTASKPSDIYNYDIYQYIDYLLEQRAAEREAAEREKKQKEEEDKEYQSYLESEGAQLADAQDIGSILADAAEREKEHGEQLEFAQRADAQDIGSILADAAEREKEYDKQMQEAQKEIDELKKQAADDERKKKAEQEAQRKKQEALEKLINENEEKLDKLKEEKRRAKEAERKAKEETARKAEEEKKRKEQEAAYKKAEDEKQEAARQAYDKAYKAAMERQRQRKEQQAEAERQRKAEEEAKEAAARKEAEEKAKAEREREAEADRQQKGKEKGQGKKNEGQFGLVSDERMEELKKRLREKLSQLNAGFDPELLAIGLEMTAGYVDRGIKKFADFAKQMKADFGDNVVPYLKAFYNGARDMPEITKNGMDKEMDKYEDVSRFDLAKIDSYKPEEEVKESSQQSEQPSEKEVNLDNYETDKYSITKQFNEYKKKDIWVVRIKGPRVDRDIYNGWRKRAKHYDGYWSSYKGVNGFVFNKLEKAKNFAEDEFSDAKVAEQPKEPKKEEAVEQNDKQVILSDKALNAYEENVNKLIAHFNEKDAEKSEKIKNNIKDGEKGGYNIFKYSHNDVDDPKAESIISSEKEKIQRELEGYNDEFRSLTRDGQIGWHAINLLYNAANMIGRARAVEDYKKAIDAKKIGDKVLDEAERRQAAGDSDAGGSVSLSAQKLEEIKKKASQFSAETEEEYGTFGRLVPKMSDEELLAYMRLDGNGDMNKAYHPELYDEYDSRHNDEMLETYNSYLQQLRDSGTTAEQAEDMLAKVQLDYETYGATDERPMLYGQQDALIDYISELNHQEEKSPSEKQGDELTDNDILDAVVNGDLSNIDKLSYIDSDTAGRLKNLFDEGYNTAKESFESKKSSNELSDADVEKEITDSNREIVKNKFGIKHGKDADVREKNLTSLASVAGRLKAARELKAVMENNKPETKKDNISPSEQDKITNLADGGGMPATPQAPSDENKKGNKDDVRGVHELRSEGLRTNGNHGGEHTGGKGEEAAQDSKGNDREGETRRVERLQIGNGGPVRHGERVKNGRNNHAERGVDYAPKSVDARIKANIDAITTLKKILSEGREATPEEMEVLRKFSGWGGLGKAFNAPLPSFGRNQAYDSLKKLLTEDELKDAEMSRNSAYYTPAPVIDSMWDIARALGFKGGNVLEGSAGIGNIIGLMPQDISRNSNIHAVEIDSVTGNILKLLYPDAKTEVQGFENTKVRNGSVDLSITNVPFVTGLRVNDTTGDKDLSNRFNNIHDFCIAKNIRKLKPGGVGIFITSSGTLDNSDSLRQWITNDGDTDVIAAFRMNNKTFGGTAATSDIIVVRRRVNGQKSPMAIDVSKVGVERVADFTGVNGKEYNVPITYNQYFIDHPEMMGGRMYAAGEKGDTYRPESTGLFPEDGISQQERLDNMIKDIEEKSKEAGSEPVKAEEENTEGGKMYEALGSGVKEGSLLLNKNSELCTASYGEAVPINVNKNKVKGHTKQECFNDYTRLKNAVQAVLDYETANDDDKGLKPLLKELNSAYEDFTAKYGQLNKNTAISFLKNDIDFPSIAALELYKERNDASGKRVIDYKKSDIFNKRIVSKPVEPQPETIEDGISTSIFKKGRIDTSFIAGLLGKSEAEVREHILSGGLGYENPATGDIDPAYIYLSGNVREKLDVAEGNNDDGRYDSNIKALNKVVPPTLPIHLIQPTLGSTWVDHKIYEKFIKDKTGVDVKVKNAGGHWVFDEPTYGVDREQNRGAGVYSELVGRQVLGTEIFKAALTGRTIVVERTAWDGTVIRDAEATKTCADKASDMKEDFRQYVSDYYRNNPEEGEKAENDYNYKFNNYVKPVIPDSLIPEHFEGASNDITLRAHQAKAAMRAVTGNIMFAHEVGSGKTFTMITAAMEMRRLGTAKKPMIVVQNATVEQFVEQAKRLYPNAKILTINEKDRTKDGRRAFYAKIRYNDWDMVVIPQSVLDMIPDSPERKMDYVRKKIAEKQAVLQEIRDMDDRSAMRSVGRELAGLQDQLAEVSEQVASRGDSKRHAVALQNAQVNAERQLNRRTDEDVTDFDGLGIDALFVDEAHNYKHLGFETTMRRGVKGVDPSASPKCASLYLKCQSVMERTGGKNIVFATGTPISNTAAEIWTFMKYLMPEEMMKSYGIYYFDDFAKNFGDIDNVPEFSTSGKFKDNNRFKGYNNLPELVRIWSTVSDTVLSSQVSSLQSKIPEMEGSKARDIYLPQTRALRSIMKYVRSKLEEFDNMTGREKAENSAIPLVMYGIAKKAAIDPRLVSADAPDDPDSKTNATVRETLKALKDSEKYKGTVAIFADNYKRTDTVAENGKHVKKVGFNLFDDIKDKLIKAGVPAEQIAIIGPGMDVKKKTPIFDKVNAGQIRVVLGSTETLGTGVNMQERLFALIHIDAPNRPMDYTQRNGRILRQGNIFKQLGIPVRILRFGVEDSLDVTAYQRLKTKGAIADSIMHGEDMLKDPMGNRTIEEEDDIFGDTVANLSGSENALLKQQAEKKLRKLQRMEKEHNDGQLYILRKKPQLEHDLAIFNKRIEKYKNIIELTSKAKEKGIEIAGKKYASVDDMKDVFANHNKSMAATMERTVEESRKKGAGRAESTMNIKINGFDFSVHTEYTAYHGEESARFMDYSCKELGLDGITVNGARLITAVKDITENILTGKDAKQYLKEEEIQKAKAEKDISYLKAHEGKPFEHAGELKKMEKLVDEYDAKMREELKAKEAKYADMDKDVDAANLDEAVKEDTEARFQLAEENREPADASDAGVHDALVAQLKDSGIDVVTDKNEYNKAIEQAQEEQEFKTGAGETYGCTIGRKIYLNPDYKFGDTPLHEYAHMWSAALRNRNPKEWENVKNLLKNTWAWDYVKKHYPNLNTEDKIADEALSLFSGKHGSEKLRQAAEEAEGSTDERTRNMRDTLEHLNGEKSSTIEERIKAAMDKVRRALSRYWKNVCDLLHVHFTTAEEVADRVMADMLNGYDPVKDMADEDIMLRRGGTAKEHTAEEKSRMRQEADNLGTRLGGENITFENNGHSGIKGWYDSRDGSVHVNLDEADGIDDVKATVCHEKLGHEGLGTLLGGQKGVDEFGAYIYETADKELRKKIVEKANENGYSWADSLRYSKAAQEVFSDMAQKGPANPSEFSLWRKVKHFIIRKCKEKGIKVRGLLNDADMRYYVLKTGEGLKTWQRMTDEQRADAARTGRVMYAMRGKPRQKKGESMADTLLRLKEYQKWKNAEKEALANNDPMPDEEKYTQDAEESYRQALSDWKRANGFSANEEIGSFPKREEGESPQDYAVRVADYEEKSDKWKDAPDYFSWMKHAQDKWREDYKAWMERYDLHEQESVDEQLYEGGGSKEETLQDQDAQQTAEQEVAQEAGIDISPNGAKRQIHLAVIERRKNIASSNMEDAIFCHDIAKEIAAIEKRKGYKKGELAKGLVYMIERPLQASEYEGDIERWVNYIDMHPDFEHLHITADDMYACTDELGEITDTYLSGGDLTDVCGRLAQKLNDMHKSDAPIDRTDMRKFGEHLANIAKAMQEERRITDEIDADDPEIKQLLQKVHDWYDEFYHLLEDAGLKYNETGYISNGYVNHVWDREKSDPKALKIAENIQRTTSANMKKRQILTYADGEALGLVPKFNDISKIMAYYSVQNNEAIANHKFLDDLKGYTVTYTDDAGEDIAQLPMITTDKPTRDVMQYYHPDPYHVAGAGDIYVLNDVRAGIRSVFGNMRTTGVDDWVHTVGHAWDVVGGVQKKIQLSLSAFHMGALSEVAIAQMINHPVRLAKTYWKIIPEELHPGTLLKNVFRGQLLDSLRNSEIPAYNNPEDAKFAAKHLVQLGATQDYAAADVNMVTEKLRELVKQMAKEQGITGAAGTALTPLAVMLDWVNKGIDRVLWNYLHDGLKIFCFKSMAADAQKFARKHNMTPQQTERLLDEVGQYTNDTFGGQYWELLDVSPATVKWMRRTSLSPDWLVSTQRHFYSNFGFGRLYDPRGFCEYAKQKVGVTEEPEDMKEYDLYRQFRSHQARICYIGGVCLFFYTVMNALNALFRWKDEKEQQKEAEEMRRKVPDYKSPYELAYPDGMKWYDYTMLGNSLGQQTHLYWGRYQDGTETYVRWGKQFREFPEMFLGPKGFDFPGAMIQRMMGKSNPNIGLIRDNLGALGIWGYSNDYSNQEIQNKYGRTIGLLAKNAQHFLPFSVPTRAEKEFKLVDLVMPSAKGFSRYKAVDYFTDFIKAGDMEGVVRTYNAAVMNKIDAEQCLKAAIQTVVAEQREEMKDGITDLSKAMKAFDDAATTQQKRILRNKIIKYLAAENYHAFTRSEALQMIEDYQTGDDVSEKAGDKYINMCTAADIRDDYRFSAAGKQAKKYVDKLKEAKEKRDTRTYNQLVQRYRAWIEVNEICSRERSDINKLKNMLGKGHDREVLSKIRETRSKYREALDNVQPPR